MKFEEAIAKFNLGETTISQIPEIAFKCIKLGEESESLLILAGMSKADNSFEIRQYLDQTINELNIESYTGLKAAFILANYYVNSLRNKDIEIIDAITKIKNECWDNCDTLIDSNKYLYDSIQFHGIIGPWYEYMEIDEFTDWVKNSDKSLKDIKQNMKDDLLKELLKWQEVFLKPEMTKITMSNEL